MNFVKLLGTAFYRAPLAAVSGLNLKSQFDPSCVFSIYLFSRERVKPFFFVTFNIIISHVFPENFIAIARVVTIFIDFSDFLTLPCCKETNDITI